MLPHYKLSPQKEVIARVASAKLAGKKIVMASGVFDLLHSAHRAYLAAARSHGDFLVVLIESDERTRRLKGVGRPVWPQEKRLAAIKELPEVDEALILPSEFDSLERFEEILGLLEPDIFAVSANSSHLDVKRDLMHRHGGEVQTVLEEIPGISTTALIQQKR